MKCPVCAKRQIREPDTVCKRCRKFIIKYVDTGLVPNPRDYGSYVPSASNVMLAMKKLRVDQDRAVIALGGQP